MTQTFMTSSNQLLTNMTDGMYYLAVIVACVSFVALIAIVMDVQVRYSKRQVGDKTITTFTIKRINYH